MPALKRIVLVLGPHRSGTSVLTKALEVLGVSLGDRLMPPSRFNPKGYHEDLDVSAFNQELLEAVGWDWHHLPPLESTAVEALLASHSERATELLREKTARCDVLGLKDPRFCLLLPFWLRIFSECRIPVSYVIALRDPLSVGRSLEIRDGLPQEKSWWIWISCILGSLAAPATHGRIIVDYNELLRDPAAQIARLAEELRLEIDRDRLLSFRESHLDVSLNRSGRDGEDPARVPGFPPLAGEIYEQLHRLATGSAGGLEDVRELPRWRREFESVRSLLDLSQKGDLAAAGLAAANAAWLAEVERLRGDSGKLCDRVDRLEGERDDLQRRFEAQREREREARTKSRLLEKAVFELERTIESLQGENAAQQAALDSVERWQLSWLRRTLTRWHRFQEESRASLPRRLERSIRRRRKELFSLFGRREPIAPPEKAAAIESRNPLLLERVNPLHRTHLLARRSLLIVAELSIPQCERYRVNQKVEVLESMGCATKVVSWTDLRACLAALPLSGGVIFYRTPAVEEVVFLTREAKRLGIITFFEIDDLVFDVAEYRQNSNLLSLPEAEQQNLLRGAELYADMLRHVDHAIGSTTLITGRLGALSAGRAFTVENALDEDLLAAAALTQNRSDSQSVTIAYGSGTRTHDADFALVGGALARLMAEHPSVRLLVAGPLQIPEGLTRFADRMIRIPLLGFADYLTTLARCDISLAPLEEGLFNDAKSNIKFLEASVLGLPSVCSPRAEFQKAIRDGENGFLAEGEDEWHRKLTTLIVDPGLRQQMGEQARADVLAGYHPETRTARQLEPVLNVAFPATPEPEMRGAVPLKVLVVNVHFAPESFGGATCVAEQLCVELGALPGTSVAVFTGTHDPATEHDSLRCFEWEGLPVFAARLPAGGSAREDFDNPAMAGLFDEVLDVVQPDVVHFHSIQMLSATMATACRERDIPYVITLHDAWWVCERQFMVTGKGTYCHQDGVDPLKCVGCTADAGFTLHRFYHLREILLKAAHLLTPSAFFRDLYVKSGVPAELISVNKNGVMRPQAVVKTARKDGIVTFAFVGGKAVHKGYFWLQEIFRGISSSNYRLKIVDLSRTFGSQPIAAFDWPVSGIVEICDPYSQDSLDEFFADVDVLLFPSLWKESFGLSVREALLRDVWVIASDGGGPAEDLRDGVNATVVPMDDTTAFREAVAEFLQQPEKLRGYANPRKDDIRLFREQAVEARAVLAAAAKVRDLYPAPSVGRAGPVSAMLKSS